MLAALLPTPAAAYAAEPVAIRAPAPDEAGLVIETVLRLSMTALAQAADGELACDIRDAIDQGRDIVQVGCPHHEIEVAGSRFRLRVDLRLQGEFELRSLIVEGDLERRSLLHAFQTDIRPIRPARA